MEDIIHVRFILDVNISPMKVKKINALLKKLLDRHHIEFTLQFELIKEETEG